MDEYISREKTKKAFNLNFGSVMDAVYANRIIDNIPAADVVPVRHGDWMIADTIIENAVCSCCRTHFQSYYQAYSYCPNCGAKMDGNSND